MVRWAIQSHLIVSVEPIIYFNLNTASKLTFCFEIFNEN
jgi:hypothetical protein